MSEADPLASPLPDPSAVNSYAAIDLGSNSFHLIVARLEYGVLDVIDRIKDMVRLAEGVDAKGRLDPTVAQRALDCLARFGERLAGIPSANVVAVGTNALRRLRDGWQFLDRMEAALGHRIEVISGEEEARLIYLGVAHGVSEQGQQRLVIDIGGGSTELAIGREFRALQVESLFFGCVAVAQHFFADGKLTAKRWNKAKAAVAVELQSVVSGLKGLGWQEVLGSSGTMRAVRAVIVGQGWSERGITPPAMEKLRRAVIKAGRVEQLKFEGLSERRRPVFASGAAIVDACLEVLDIDEIRVTEYALREGLLYDLIGRSEHPDPRLGTVATLKSKYGVDIAQSERVQAVGLDFFGQVRDDWELPGESVDWLVFAAGLHEIGLTISHHGYHRHGAYLLSNTDLPGFSRREQLIVATLVLNHRRKPNPGSFELLPESLRPAVRRLTALLRLAVLFCRSRIDDDAARIALAAGDGKLTVTLPPGWNEQHPLTAEDLRQERAHLKKLGVTLKLADGRR